LDLKSDFKTSSGEQSKADRLRTEDASKVLVRRLSCGISLELL
jgi:hypothetical protein